MKECRQCHISQDESCFSPAPRNRDKVTSYCKTCSAANRRAWRKTHPDEAKASNRRSMQAWKASGKEAQYVAEHRTQIRARQKQWRLDNIDAVRERDAAYYQANKERIDAVNEAWRHANPQQWSAITRKALLRKKGAPVNDFTFPEWLAIVAAFDGRCAYCACLTDDLTQDHFIPLSKGGAHTAANIVPACRSCNASKNNKYPISPMPQPGDPPGFPTYATPDATPSDVEPASPLPSGQLWLFALDDTGD